MMLVDRATIFVRSGRGGHGCVSFRREKFVPKGGPDGGDGGHGGDVVLVGDESMSSLLPVTPRPHYRAERGEDGRGKSQSGATGADCVVHVPVGTLVHDRDTGELVADVAETGQRVVVAHGGRGGLGNEHFKSATNQTPREATPGGEWEERTLVLELKLIADVGLVGKPNAGKSTMLRAVSRATPKVADYPFTTLQPNVGIAELPGERRLVVADIPGLIEGAAAGAGLGHDFLRHIERTRLLIHVLDVDPVDGSAPAANYAAIRRELAAYGDELAAKPEIIVLNKIDTIPEADRDAWIADLGAGLPDGVRLASAVTGEGVRELLESAWLLVQDAPARAGWS